MRFPTVKLIGKALYKVLYKGEKWAFEKGVGYPDIHPDFAAHLSTLVDDRKNKLFAIDYGATVVTNTVSEHSGFAIEEAEKIKAKSKKQTKDNKSGRSPKKAHKAYKLPIKKEKKKK